MHVYHCKRMNPGLNWSSQLVPDFLLSKHVMMIICYLLTSALHVRFVRLIGHAAKCRIYSHRHRQFSLVLAKNVIIKYLTM